MIPTRRFVVARGTLLLTIALSLFVPGCTEKPTAEHDHAAEAGHGGHGSDEHDHGKEEKGGHGEEDHRKAEPLTVEKLEHAGVVFSEIGSGHVDDGVPLLGTVHPNGDRLAHITPRFPGTVREVRKTIGDSVRTGEVLAVVESSVSLAPYDLRTQIDGTIIAKHLTRGEAVDNERQAFVIADLSSVWIELSVYQRDLDRVRVGETVRVRAGDDGPQAEGTITYITPGVEETMRTATARVVLPNPEGRWRIGTFVEAYAVSPHAAALVVPVTAIQTLEGKSVVFVAESGRVEDRPVTLGHRGETLVEVLDGVSAGDRVATANAFLMKAELGKSEAEHEH